MHELARFLEATEEIYERILIVSRPSRYARSVTALRRVIRTRAVELEYDERIRLVRAQSGSIDIVLTALYEYLHPTGTVLGIATAAGLALRFLGNAAKSVAETRKTWAEGSKIKAETAKIADDRRKTRAEAAKTEVETSKIRRELAAASPERLEKLPIHQRVVVLLRATQRAKELGIAIDVAALEEWTATAAKLTDGLRGLKGSDAEKKALVEREILKPLEKIEGLKIEKIDHM